MTTTHPRSLNEGREQTVHGPAQTAQALVTGQPMSRRAALRLMLAGAGTAVLAACAPSAPAPAPTAAPAAQPVVQPTAQPAPKPAATAAAPAPAPTAAPAATTPSTSSGQAKPVAQPKSGGTLRLALTASPASLDGHLLTTTGMESSWLPFDRLTGYDLNLKPQPLLAESWDLSSDYKQFKLNLRKGVRYHTGREFTSEDVKHNLLRPRDPKVASGILAGVSNWFSSIETPDTYTVILKTESPRPGFFDGLELFNMVDREHADGADPKMKSSGTGPFILKEWVQGEHLTFTKNPNYWQSGRPYLDSVVVYPRDQQSMIVQLESGALDMVKIPAVDDFARLKGDPNYQASIHPNSGTFFEIGISTVNKPFDNKQVRQAFNHALDRKRFAEVIFKGNAQPISLPWSQSSPAYEASKNDAYPFDLDKAKSLLSSAGVSNLETDLLIIGIAQPQLYQFAQIYQGDLAKIGVKLNIQNLEQAVWLDLVINKKFSGLWGSNDTLSNVSPGTLFNVSPGWNPAGNHSSFKTDAYAQLVASATAETDPAKQKQIYTQLNDFILDETFTMPIITNPITVLPRRNVHGIGYLMHIGALSLTDVWMD